MLFVDSFWGIENFLWSVANSKLSRTQIKVSWAAEYCLGLLRSVPQVCKAHKLDMAHSKIVTDIFNYFKQVALVSYLTFGLRSFRAHLSYICPFSPKLWELGTSKMKQRFSSNYMTGGTGAYSLYNTGIAIKLGVDKCVLHRRNLNAKPESWHKKTW